MTNPFMAAAERRAEERKDTELQAITGGTRMSLDSDREQDIKTQRLAEAMGTDDTEFVGRNYAYLDRYARNRKLYEQLDKKSVAHDLLVKGDYQDDIETLAEVEKNTSYLGVMGKKFDKGRATADGGRALFNMMWGDPADFDASQYTDLVSGRPDDGLNFVQKIPTDTAEMVGLYTGILPDAGMAAAYGGAGGGFATGVPGALLGAAGGMKLGTAKEIFEIEAGWAFNEFRGLTDANGDQVDIDAARGAALLVGGVNAGLEFVGLSMIPGVRGLMNMLRAGGKNGIKQILKRPELAKRLGEIAYAYTAGAVGEGVTEGVQELTVEAGKYALQGAMPTEDQMAESLGNAFEASQVGFRAALGLGAPATVINTTSAVSDSRKSKQLQDVFKALGDNVKNSKLHSDAPEQFKAFIQQVQERHGLVDTLYMDAEAATVLFQDAVDLKEAMPGTFKSLQEAMETGSYVAIPLDEFVAHVAPSDKLAEVMQDITFDPLDATPRQMEKAKSESEAILKEYQDGMAEIDKAEDPLYGQVYVELLAAGRRADVAEMEATLFTAGIKRMAERQGMDPLQYYREQNISIRGEVVQNEQIDIPTYTGGLLNLIRDGKGPKDSDVYGPSLIEYLISIGGINEPEGGELASRDVDKQMPEYGRKRLAREQGLSMEEAFERARDSGYLSVDGFAGEENALLDAIDRELKGERVYSGANVSPQMQELQAQLNDLREMMDRAGVNVDTMTNEEIMDRLGVMELEQAAQIQSPEFKAWFGDSKAVDDNGQPLVVYHGAPDARFITEGDGIFKGINERYGQPSNGKDGAFWFAADRATAITYADDRRAFDYQAADPGIVSAYLKLENPLIIDGRGKEWREAQQRGKTRDVIDQARDEGRDGVIIRNVRDRYQDNTRAKPTDTFVVFNSSQVKSATDNRGTFDPGNPSILFQGKSSPRGYLTIRPNDFTITLTRNANLSTFIHESGHLYLELMKKAAMGEGAPADILADWETIKVHLGSDGELTTEQHETFARSFEAYLMEGKAPSQELRGVFNRFKSWMISVYRSIRNLDVELTDEIRGVFDRLLASEESTKLAAQDMTAAFNTEESVSSPASFKRLAEMRLQAIAEAEDEMIAQAQAEIRRMKSDAYRQRKKDLTEQITADVDAQPVYAVQRLLKKGNDEGMDLPANLLGRRLSTKALKDMFGDASATRKLVGMTASEGGIHPDTLAEIYGFGSGYEMVQKIIAAPARSKVIAERVQSELDAEFGNMATDTDTVERAAVAVHNDKMARLLVEEAREMARLLGAKDRPTLNESTKLAARAHIKAQPLRNLRPHQHYQAEVKAAREAAEFVASGNVEKALAAKRRQLLNHHLYREARHAVDRSEVIRNRLKKFESPKYMKNIRKGDRASADAIDALLSGVEFKRTTLKAVDAREAVLKYVNQLLAEGEPVHIDPALYADAKMKNWRNMTMAELEQLDSSVRALAKKGRDADKIRVEGEKVDINEHAALLGAVAAQSVDKKQLAKYGHDFRSDAAKLAGGLAASLLKIEFEMRLLDGGEINGIWARTIFEPFNEAQRNKETMLLDYSNRLAEIMGSIDQEHARYLRSKITFMGEKMPRENLYVVALNMGNQGNWDRLFSDAWKGQEDVVMREIQKHLTLKDFRRIEALGQMIDSMYEPMAEVSDRVDGIRPPKVEPRPLVLDKYGVTLSGWYYPVAYKDASTSPEPATLKATNSVDMGASPITGQVAKSMTKERVKKVRGVIDLSMSHLPMHLHQTVHYITHYEAVQNFEKLRRSPAFNEMYRSFMGEDGYAQLRSWAQNIASNGDIARTMHQSTLQWEALLRRARFGGSIIGLGWKLAGAAMQVLGAGPAAKEVGGVRMARWLSTLTFGRASTLGQAHVHPAMQRALDASSELRMLNKQMDRDIREFTDRSMEVIQRNKAVTASQWLMENSYYWLIAVQRHINAATFLAGFEQAQEKGMTDAEAVQYAEAVVRQTQSGGGLKDLAGIQQGQEITKILTLFYTYFSVQYNQLRLTGRLDLIRGFIQGKGQNGRAKSLGKFVAANMWIVILPALAEMLRRYDEDDDDSFAEQYAKNIASTYIAGVPVVRDAYRAWSADYNMPNTPLDRLIGTIGDALGSTSDLATGELEWQDARNIAEAFTMITFIPAYQAYGAVEAVAASDDFGELIRNLFLGTPYQDRRNLDD